MKSILFAAALAALSVPAFAQAPVGGVRNVAPAAPASLKIGEQMPMADQALKTTNGSAVSLNKMKTNDGLLVMFSCNTCPFVVKSQQRTIQMMEMAKEMGIGMIIINSNEAQRGDADSYEAMVKYGKTQGYTAPYAMDEGSKLADAFGASRTPEVYLFNAKGTLVYKGAMEDNPSDPSGSKKMFLADAMKNMKSGQPISPEETKSIGCTIKRGS